MARAGMARWRGKEKDASTGPAEGDEVQRSLELLDRVLSEFDDLESANLVEVSAERAPAAAAVAAAAAAAAPVDNPGEPASSTPEDESPSLGGHQSEDDGYMSMNGRRNKFVLSFRPVEDEGPTLELPPPPEPPPDPPPAEMADFPPPPEEAERLISTLLPRVSPGNSAKRSNIRRGKAFLSSMTLGSVDHRPDDRLGVTTATQTTLPKTRHQRPFGWETDASPPPFHLQEAPPTQHRFGSLPYDGARPHARFPPPWLQRPGPLPPRTLPGAIERHREVRRRCADDATADGDAEPGVALRTLDERSDDDRANFSDDSLDELLPPPTAKRNSIAWEVPLGLDDVDPLLTPGSTKVIGRRRRRSGEHSSTSSIHRLRDVDDAHRLSADEDAASPFSEPYYDSSVTAEYDDAGHLLAGLSSQQQLTPNGTYVIRKGRKKERKPVAAVIPSLEAPHSPSTPGGDLKRCSSTFDNIKSLLKEGLLEGLDDAPPDFSPPTPPTLVRVVSLPSLSLQQDHEDDDDNADFRHRELFTIPRPERTAMVREESHHRLARPNELAVTLEEEEDTQFGSNTDESSDNPGKADEFRSSDEENKLIMQLEKGAAGSQFLDASSESLLLCDTELLSIADKDRFGLPTARGSSGSNRVVLERNSSSYRNCKSEDSLSTKHKLAFEVDTKDPWVMATDMNHVNVVHVVEDLPPKDYDIDVHVHDDEKPREEFKVTVAVVQHEFPPLPPSPEDADDDDDDDVYAEILHRSPLPTGRRKADTLPDPVYRSLEPRGGSEGGDSRYLQGRPEHPTPHEPMSSLKTRSMDAGFSRGNRSHRSKRDIPSERRTLPTELPGPLRRRTFQKRSSAQSPQETLQTSCSLPETPIFARGCDIPRTPHRRAPDVPGGVVGMARTAPRPNGLPSAGAGVGAGYRRIGTGVPCHSTTMGLGAGSLSQALVGAELLRMAGGPGRGWYPRHRQHARPASIEHLDRVAAGHSPGHSMPSPWDARGDPRKPLTLPPNMSPKFFHRSPREALRRVTSLLIRTKGSNPKETKKDSLSPTGMGPVNGEASGEGSRQKRGFFKNFWKRSRHYSLEHQ